MLYSFDVFDTLVTRKTATPKGIFSLIQYELMNNKHWDWIPKHVRDNFYDLRITAEKEARASYRYIAGSEEVSLNQIYSFIPLNTDGEIGKSLLIELEITTEIVNSVAIPENINKVKSLVSKNHRVVLVSDMYLPSEVIRKILCQHEDIFSEIPIYASSEIGFTKSSGNLFKFVQNLEKVSYDSWTHIGDNSTADFKVPRRLGINAEWYNYESFTSLEKGSINLYQNNPQVQLAIGASRNVRLLALKKTKEYKLGCSLAGHLLTPYVLWLLNDAIEKGVRRLYFIARDGYVLKEIADEIIKQSNLTISTHYIYGSRLAWKLFDLNQDYINDITKLSKIHSIYDLVTVLLDGIGGENDEYGISKSTILDQFPLEYREDTKSLTSDEIQHLMNCLLENSSFMDCYNSCLSFKRELVKQYLIQEIDVSDSFFAMVDLNGSGVTMDCLGGLMSEFCQHNLNVYYMFNCHSEYPLTHVTKRIYAINTPNYFEIELLCRALHGQTVGYKKDNGVITPILEGGEGLELLQWGYDKYISGIIDFVKTSIFYSAYEYGSGFTLYSYYLTAYYQDYDSETLDLLATIPFSKTTKSGTCRGYAPRVSLIQLSTDFIRYKGKHCLCTNNVKLSMKRSSPLLRFMLKYVFDGDGILYNIASWGYRVLKNIMGLFNQTLGRGSK